VSIPPFDLKMTALTPIRRRRRDDGSDPVRGRYAVRTQAAQALGEGPTQALIDEVVDRLRERLAPH